MDTLEGHTHYVTACAVTPDGRHVVSASNDKTLKVWDLASGHALATLEGHTNWVTACAVTPDGRHVVSASNDTTLKVWDLASGRALATLEGHTSEVTACAVTPDGRHVVSASHDKTLKVWNLKTYACSVTHRGSAPYDAVATTATIVVAGDRVGSVWFLDLPPSYCRIKTSSVLIHPPEDIDGTRVSSPHQPRAMHVTPDDLLTRLSGLLPSQFEEVVFRARIPAAHLSSIQAPQATRAIEAIRYLEQQNRLEQLLRILEQVATGL